MAKQVSIIAAIIIAVITAVITLAIGFAIGNYVGFSRVNNSLTKGDISKVDLYSGQKEDPELEVYFDKLKNNKNFLKETQDGVALLKERVENLNTLTSQLIKTCSDIPELQEAVKPIQSLQAKAYNTNNSIDKFSNGLENIVAGKKVAYLEQASNNAYVGFSKIENQLDVSKKFVETASEYLKDHENEELDKQVKELAYYCAQDAILNASTEDMEYWSDKIGPTTTLGKLFSEIRDHNALNKYPFPYPVGFPYTQTLKKNLFIFPGIEGFPYTQTLKKEGGSEIEPQTTPPSPITVRIDGVKAIPFINILNQSKQLQSTQTETLRKRARTLLPLWSDWRFSDVMTVDR